MDISKINMCWDNVLVKRLEASEKIGSVYVPNNKSNQGVVVALGPGRLIDNGEFAELDVHVGDTVVFQDFAGTLIKLEDEEFLCLKMTDIICGIMGDL